MKKLTGMTLLEVMLAITIFAIAALPVMGIVTNELRNVEQLKKITFANWVASNQLTEIKLKKIWPDTATWVDGKVTMAKTEWLWRYKGIPTEQEWLRAVKVEVRQNEEESSIATLLSYLSK